MAATIIPQASSRFEDRFFLNALVPLAVFVPCILATIVEGTWRVSEALEAFESSPVPVQLALPIAFFAFLWLAASFLASQWTPIVRIFEGYPYLRAYQTLQSCPVVGVLFRRIEPPGLGSHQRRLKRLARRAEDSERWAMYLHLHYPDRSADVLPTLLGNVLRAAETYPARRYGADAILLWTRLQLILPEAFGRDVERYMMNYQLPLVISFLSGILAAASLTLALNDGDLRLFQGVFLGSMSTALAAYWLSIRGAINYGMAIRSAFDLHREQLLERFHVPSSGDEAESERFHALRQFILRGRRPAPPPEPHSTAHRDTVIRRLLNRLSPSRHTSSHRSNLAERPDIATDRSAGAYSRRGIRRLRTPRLWVVAVATALLGVAWGGGTIVRESQEAVVVTDQVRAFEGLVTHVEVRRFATKRLPEDAIPPSELSTHAFALRTLRKGNVVLRSDLSLVKRQADGLMASIPTSSHLVRSFDLRDGDQVVVALASDRQEPQIGCDQGPRSRLITGRVLAVMGSDHDTSRPVLTELDPAREADIACLGLEGAELLLRTP